MKPEEKALEFVSTVRVVRLGNSHYLLIPAKVAESFGIKDGTKFLLIATRNELKYIRLTEVLKEVRASG